MRKIFYIIKHDPYETVGIFDSDENLLEIIYSCETVGMSLFKHFDSELITVDIHGQTRADSGTVKSTYINPSLEYGKELYHRLFNKFKETVDKECKPIHRVVTITTDIKDGTEVSRVEEYLNIFNEKMGIRRYYFRGEFQTENNFYRDWYYGEHGPQITINARGERCETNRTMCKLKDTYEKRGDMEINGISQTFYPNGKVKHQTMFDHYEVLWEKSYDENGNLIEGEHE